MGGGNFDKVVDQNFPYFFISPYFSICTFTKKTLPSYFYFTPIFHWANYTLNKTFSLERKKAQNGGESLSKTSEGDLSHKTGGGEVAPDFDSWFGRIEATGDSSAAV